MIKPLILRTFIQLKSPSLLSSCVFSFATESKKTKKQDNTEEQLSVAENFYRSTIRKININDKGRGKFTQHHLIRLTKITQKSDQLPLLFEGYYNYLGHFTVISNKVVDRMLHKALSFQEKPLASIIEIYQNHNYLGYFPSFQVTLKVITVAQKDEEIFLKLIKSFYDSPLIKFDQEIERKLFSIVQQPSTPNSIFSSIIKLLMQRSVLKIMSKSLVRVFLKLSKSIENRLKNGSITIMNSNQYVFQFLKLASQRKNQSVNDKIACFALFYGARKLFYQNLMTIQDENRVDAILNYTKNCPQSFTKSLEGYLSKKRKLKPEIRQKVEKLISGCEANAE